MNVRRMGSKTALALILSASVAFGQANKNRSKKMTTLLGMWSISGMVDQASTNIARRYNLNEQQETYTRALMANRVQAFINEHGAEFERLLAEIMRQGADPTKPPSAEIVKRWGRGAGPLFEAARKGILDGNMEWREILNEQQKKTHDADLAQMRYTFEIMDKQFKRWQEGKYAAGETPFPGLAQMNRQAQQRIGQGVNPITTSEHFWKIWVRRFIRDYKLDKAQAATALSILKEYTDQATTYRQSNEAELTLARLEVRKARDANDRPAVKNAYDKLRKLNKPIDQMFVELKERLLTIPTEDQKADYNARHKPRAAKKAVTKTGPQAATKPTSAPAPGPASKPAREPAIEVKPKKVDIK